MAYLFAGTFPVLAVLNISLLQFIIYRIFMYIALMEMGTIEKLSMPVFLSATIIQDISILLPMSMVLGGCILLLPVRVVWSRGIDFLFLLWGLSLTFLLIIALGFFRAYEIPFRLSAIRSDFGAIWQETFYSALNEFDFFIGSFLFFQLIVMFLFFTRKKVKALFYGLSIFFVIFLLLSAVFMPWGSLSRIQIDKDHTLADIVNSPLSDFLKARHLPIVTKKQTAQSSGMKKFTYLFNDSSVLDSTDIESSHIPKLEINSLVRPQRKAYNIVLYFFESTPAKYVDSIVWGKELTPNWNRLKKKGVYATRHYANFPLSINAFHLVYCSAYPLPDGRWIPMEIPDIDMKCASEALKEKGYRTGYIMAGTLEYAKQYRFMAHRRLDLLLDSRKILKGKYSKALGPWGAADERAMIEPALKFIEESKDTPWFLTFYAYNPHHPYNYGYDHKPLFYDENLGNLSDGDTYKNRGRLNYYNSLHFADFTMGEIVHAIEKKAPGNTIFIFLADHGEAFYEHRGNYNHPHFLYEENIRVPLLLYAPGILQPSQFLQPTSHLDILPTILDIIGGPSQEYYEGRSLFTRIWEPRAIFLHTHWDIELLGLVDGPFKYIRRTADKRAQLFNLEVDPFEKENLSSLYPKTLEQFSRAIERQRIYAIEYYRKMANYEMKTGAPSQFDY